MATQLNTTNLSVPTSPARSGLLAGSMLRSEALAKARSDFRFDARCRIFGRRDPRKLYITCLRSVITLARGKARFAVAMKSWTEQRQADELALGPARARLMREIESLEMANFHTAQNRAAVAHLRAELAALAN